MVNFGIGRTSFDAAMTSHPSNTTHTSSNTTQTPGMKEEEEKEEKEEEQPQQKKTKHQKKKQKEKETQEKLSQTEAELATLKASNEVTIIERDTLKKDFENSNKLHEASRIRAAQSLTEKYNDVKKLRATIKELETKIENLTAEVAEEDDIVAQLIKDFVVESVKRAEDLKALEASILEKGRGRGC